MKKIILLLMFLVVSLFAKIDINSASAKELATLKGIGDKKAQTIIEYRIKHGDFKSVDELIKVNGIGKATLKSIKNDVEVK